MKVDHVLILAAGKGTRMGEVGKILPKVLWPIYEKSLIELQVAYAKSLAPDAKVYANLFHQKDLIKCQVSKLDCSIIIEEEELDIGGGVHNLASKLNYQGNLLILNGDQFLCFDKGYFQKGLDTLESCDSVLYTYSVNSNDLYNSLSVEGKRFRGVVDNNEIARNKKHQTYTGMSLINLEKLKPQVGKSKFFDTVANYKLNKIDTLPVNEVEYWDFGTLSRYCESMYRLLRSERTLFKNFLIQESAFIEDKLDGENYHAKFGINLTADYLSTKSNSIILGEHDFVEIPEKSVVLGNKAELIPMLK